MHQIFSRIDYNLVTKKVEMNLWKEKVCETSSWPQWNETRNQRQKEGCKENKHMEAKSHEPEKQICPWRDRRRDERALQTSDNKNTATLNLWGAAKAILRGKFKAVQAFLKKQEKSQINNKTYHLKELEIEQTKLIVSRRYNKDKRWNKYNRDLKNRKYQ